MFDAVKWATRAAVPAVLTLAMAAGARADDAVSIDRALATQAPEVLKYLREHKCKNVAVLKFLAGVEGGPMRDDLGALNRTLADRLEVALVLGLTDDDDDRLCVLTRASDEVAKSGDMALTHRAPEGRRAFFAEGHQPRFQPAWGVPKAVPADAFLTGEAVVSPDYRTVKVRIQVFDRDDAGDPEPKTLGDWFTAAVDPRTLTELGVSYAHKKGAKDELYDTPAQQVSKLEEVVGPSIPGAPPPPPDKEKEREREWDQLAGSSPVKLDILYNGAPAPVRAGAVQTPKPTDAVAFRLRNTDPNTTYGVVLKVNGESTIDRQRLQALDCYKWILKPGGEVTVDAFQKGDDKGDQFTVLPPEASKGMEVNYGDSAGVISLTAFRAAAKNEDAFVLNEEKRNQEVRAIGRGSLVVRGEQPPRSLKALQDELTAEADPAMSSHEGRKGLVVPGKEVGSKIQHIDFVPFPREELSLVVRYYQPQK